MTQCCSNPKPADNSPHAWFAGMIGHCYEYAVDARANGKGIVGIMCEFTPRELIMAADAVPVCLCGGSQQTIASAEQHLPANLCPLIKSTYGYHVQKSNPFLEMADLIVAETTCDGKKKMYELLAQSKPMHVLELPQKPDDPDAMQHWRNELHKFKSVLEDRFCVGITDDRLRCAIRTMNSERSLRRRLAELMTADSPPITGRQLLALKSSISGIQADFEQYETLLQLHGETPPTASANGRRVRVLLTGVPIAHGAERIVDIIEQSGGLVVCMENCTGLKPILEDVDEDTPDPMEAIAQKYFHLPCSVMTRNDRRMELLQQLARQYRPDCIIDLVWQACLTYDVESHFVRRLAAEKLNLPCLKIETDYSPSDSARIAVRIEALFETVRKD